MGKPYNAEKRVRIKWIFTVFIRDTMPFVYFSIFLFIHLFHPANDSAFTLSASTNNKKDNAQYK